MSKVLIIAEAGVNHNGDINMAKKLIDVAAEAGVDYVKFQTFKASNLVSKIAERASYQNQNTGNQDSQYEMLQKLELSVDDHKALIDYCKKKNVEFLSTGFDLESIDLLLELGIDLFKIPSGEITNLPYLQKIGSLQKKVIMSTGMCTINEIDDALKVLLDRGTKIENITILHCNTEYPTPMSDVHLLTMNEIKKHFNVNVGYSDHTLGIEVPIAAVALGAQIIEKHFTLNRKLEGPDHAASLEPSELIQMVKAIRNIEIALGESSKKPSPSESKNINIARKSIHISKAVKKGHVLQDSDIIMKRPGDGISPMELQKVIGRKICKDLDEEYKLNWEDLE